MRYSQRSAMCDVDVRFEQDGELVCVGCTHPGHRTHSTDEMLSHLRVHQAYGDHVPMRLLHRLDEDRARIDGVPGPHTRHDDPCALCDPDDPEHPAHTPASVRAAYVQG